MSKTFIMKPKNNFTDFKTNKIYFVTPLSYGFAGGFDSNSHGGQWTTEGCIEPFMIGELPNSYPLNDEFMDEYYFNQFHPDVKLAYLNSKDIENKIFTIPLGFVELKELKLADKI